ncbi:hypothetical protein FRC17_000269, partial [Serendipita sp. 399]
MNDDTSVISGKGWHERALALVNQRDTIALSPEKSDLVFLLRVQSKGSGDGFACALLNVMVDNDDSGQADAKDDHNIDGRDYVSIHKGDPETTVAEPRRRIRHVAVDAFGRILELSEQEYAAFEKEMKGVKELPTPPEFMGQWRVKRPITCLPFYEVSIFSERLMGEGGQVQGEGTTTRATVYGWSERTDELEQEMVGRTRLPASLQRLIGLGMEGRDGYDRTLSRDEEVFSFTQVVIADMEKAEIHDTQTRTIHAPSALVGVGLQVSKNNHTVETMAANVASSATDGTSTTIENALIRIHTSSENEPKDDQPVQLSENKEYETINEGKKPDQEAKSGIPGVDESTLLLLTGKKLALAHIGFLLAVFCAALDQTIVATALPKLASQFNALDRLTWVVSAYFLTQAGLMLTFGQILTVARSKWVYFTCIVVFEIGSLICGVAPSMNVLILGRAVQGQCRVVWHADQVRGIYSTETLPVAEAGNGADNRLVSCVLLASILTILSQITRLEQRPLLFGSLSGAIALASVIGPLLGGVLTDRSTWRWCFYINLPFGAISLAAVLFFQPSSPPPPNPLYPPDTTPKEKWLSLDWVGALLSLGTIACLLLPLQWGGVSRPWNDKVVIALFAAFAILLVLFLGWEKHKGARAMMPLSLIFQRRRTTLLGAALMMFLVMIPFLCAIYYLPLFYQSKGRTAAQSGVDIIPYILAFVVFGFVTGGIVNATGHYLTLLIVGPLISAVGAGLLFTITEHTSTAKLVGYQILFGSGVGMVFQLPIMAVQAEYAYEPELIPQASSLLTFLQLVGGVVGIA